MPGRYHFENDTDTGIFYSSADTIGFVVNNREVNLAERHHENAMELMAAIHRRAGWDSVIFISLLTGIGVTIWSMF